MSLDFLLHNNLSLEPKAEIPDECGIVTAATSNFFPGVQLLYTSLVKSHSNGELYVYDLGFSSAQVEWCRKQPRLRLMRVNPDSLLVKQDKPYWSAFNRPWFILNSPFRITLWMDPDCIIIAPLSPAFNHIKNMQALMLINLGCTPIDRSVYDDPVIKGYHCSTREQFTVTTGVIGFDRHRALDYSILDTWSHLTTYIVNVSNMSSFMINWDETIFRIVVQAMNLFDLLWPDVHWNSVVYPRFRTVEEALADLKKRFPDEYVLHFFGRPKIWETEGLPVLDINPHLIT